jgi:hypothetical protein
MMGVILLVEDEQILSQRRRIVNTVSVRGETLGVMIMVETRFTTDKT